MAGNGDKKSAVLNPSDAYLQVMHVVPGAFTPEEMDLVGAHGDALAQGAATVTMPPAPAIGFLYDRISAITQHVNASIYGFALDGFAGPFLYSAARHGGPAQGRWSTDEARGPAWPKICLTVQLSDPASYEGGDLEAHGRPSITAAPRDRGAVVIFPFYTLRRLSPVRSGVRRAATILAAGPRLE